MTSMPGLVRYGNFFDGFPGKLAGDLQMTNSGARRTVVEPVVWFGQPRGGT